MRYPLLAFAALVALVGVRVPEAMAATVDFLVSFDCPTCLVPISSGVWTTTSEGGGSYLVTHAPFTTILSTGSSLSPPLVATNDNLLFYPGANPFDEGGVAAYPTSLGINYTFVDACGALGPGFNGCAVEYPDANAIDGYIHPTTVSVTPTPLPAALPLFAGGLGALGLFGWRRKRKAQADAA
jgi:hypothetical protein